MTDSLPIPELSEDWFVWVQWASSPDRDQSKVAQFIGFDEMFWVVENEPDNAWSAILIALADPRCEPFHGNLAASVVEEPLGKHDLVFIERIEMKAREDVRFARLLGGV